MWLKTTDMSLLLIQNAWQIEWEQADHLRRQTMRHMSRILSTNQAACALLAMGEFFHRLRALSSLWAARPREPT